LSRRGGSHSFVKTYADLGEILTDHRLASLGDTYVNFVASLALSNRTRKPTGIKVKGSVLAEALRRAELRDYLPSRMTRHLLADAAEALVVYGWLSGQVTLDESVEMLGGAEDMIEGFAKLLVAVKNRITFP
jgi:hypothetical protein